MKLYRTVGSITISLQRISKVIFAAGLIILFFGLYRLIFNSTTAEFYEGIIVLILGSVFSVLSLGLSVLLKQDSKSQKYNKTFEWKPRAIWRLIYISLFLALIVYMFASAW